MGRERVWLGLLLTLAVGSSAQKSLGTAKLYLIRHGQSTANVWPNRLIHPTEDVQLTKLGEKQARTTSSCLAEKGVAPDLVFSSCLVRAEETALLLFPNKTVTVHVAPYISELPWRSEALPENIPTGKEKQLGVIGKSLSEGDEERDSFDWVSKWTLTDQWPKECGPPNWERFLAWLAERPEVQTLVETRLHNGEVPHIAVASHGMFLKRLLVHHNWKNVMLWNAEAVEAELPLLGDADGNFVSFGSFYNTTMMCRGQKSTTAQRIKHVFYAGCLTMGLCMCAVILCCSGCSASARSRKVSSSLKDPLLVDDGLLES